MHKVSTMPKTRKSRSNRFQAAANLTGPGSPACSAGNLTINYTAMPTEALRFMLSQRDLNQTGPRRVRSLAFKKATLRLRLLRRRFPNSYPR